MIKLIFQIVIPFCIGFAISVLRRGRGRETFEERCTTCKEYDQKNHCCHRWTDCIRRTVDELKEYYAFHSIEEKPDEDGEYLVQYGDGRLFVKQFEMERDVFGEWMDFIDFDCETVKEFVESPEVVAWARLPERYKNDDT